MARCTSWAASDYAVCPYDDGEIVPPDAHERSLDRATRALIAAMIRRAVEDARGRLFYAEPARRLSVQREAHDWLHSDAATLLALSVGISANRYRAILQSLPLPKDVNNA